MTAAHGRLEEARQRARRWQTWGPYSASGRGGLRERRDIWELEFEIEEVMSDNRDPPARPS